MKQKKLFTAIVIIGIVSLIGVTTAFITTAPISMAKNGHGIHGCDLGSQGFNSSHGKCFHNSTGL